MIDLETLTTLVPESTPGETRRYQIAKCLSQEVPGKAWQVWHATKSVAGVFRGPRFCDCHTLFVACHTSATLLKGVLMLGGSLSLALCVEHLSLFLFLYDRP